MGISEPLCLGCLVSWKSSPYIICCIRDNYTVGISSPELKEKFCVDQEELEPIPITPDFLETHGFKKVEKKIGDYSWVGWSSKDNQVTLSDNSNTQGRDWSVHIDDNRFETIGGFDVQYIHQLQIGLWLCGRDDLINTIKD